MDMVLIVDFIGIVSIFRIYKFKIISSKLVNPLNDGFLNDTFN